MIRSAALLAVLLPLFPLPARAGNEVAARRLYEEGLDRYRRGEFPDALSSLTRSIGESKGFLLSYSVRAQVRRALGDAAGSAADAKAALGIGSPRNAETFVARGNARFLARQDRAALGDFEDALHKDEEYADAYLGRGRVRDAAGDRAGAMADWQKALKLDPKLDLARYNLAAALNESGKPAQAIEELTRALRDNPRFALPYSLLGNIFAAKGDAERAAKAYSKAILLAPDLYYPYVGRALVQFQRGKDVDAFKDLDQAVKCAPQDYAPYFNRGEAHYRLGEKPAALADFHKALEARLDHPPAGMAMGHRLMENGLWKDAAAMFDKARAAAEPLGRRDWEEEALLARSRALTRVPDDSQALRDLDLAVKLSTGSPRALTERAKLQNRLGRPAKADEDLKAALGLKPDYAPALAERGALRAARGQSEAALKDFDAALRADPNLPEAYNNRGILYATVYRDYDKAAADIEKAVALEPRTGAFLLNLAAARLKRGEALLAVEALDKALEQKADPVRALQLRAEARFFLGDRTAAQRDISEARTANPRSAAALGSLGFFQMRSRQFPEAVKTLSDAIALDKQAPRAYLNRGLAYAGDGQLKSAESDFLKAASLDNRPSEALTLACQAQRLLGRAASAVTTCSRALAVDPEYAPAYLQRGLARLAMGGFQQAIRDLDDGSRLGLPQAPAFLARALAHAAVGQLKEADRAYRTAMGIDPLAKIADLPLAGTAPDPRWDFHARVEALEPALAKASDDASAYLLRGDSFHSAGYYDKAILEYTRALEFDGRSAAAYLDRGASLSAQDSLDAAEADLRRGTELDSADPAGPLALVTLLTVRGRYADALRTVAWALKAHDKSAELYVKAGNLRYFLRDLPKAQENFLLALKLEPNNPAGRNGLGLCYFARRQYPQALENFSRAIEARPGYDRYYRNRASAFVNMRQYDNAAADYGLALASTTDPDLTNEYRKLLQDSLARAGSTAAK